jgi:hypothetical protein
MKRNVWPAARKGIVAGSVLALVFLGLVALRSASSESGAQALAVFTTDGGQFAKTYELRDDGVLESTRHPVGGRPERRQLLLESIDKDRYLDLLETGGYLTEAPENLRLPEVQSKLGAVVDIPHWRVRVHRSPSEIISVEVPPPIAGRVFPELTDIPYVAVAWQLIEEFEDSWDRSQRVEP